MQYGKTFKTEQEADDFRRFHPTSWKHRIHNNYKNVLEHVGWHVVWQRQA